MYVITATQNNQIVKVLDTHKELTSFKETDLHKEDREDFELQVFSSLNNAESYIELVKEEEAFMSFDLGVLSLMQFARSFAEQ